MADDSELLLLYCRDRSEAAFTELVGRYVNLVYHAALRQVGGDAHMAQDVSQAVFTQLALKASKLARRTSVAGWLYTCTRFIAARQRRGERRRSDRERKAQAMIEIEGDVASSIDWGRLGPVIDDVLHGLAERDRELVLLRYFQDNSFVEISSRLGVSSDAARFRLARALETMRARLARHGVSSTSAALALALAGQAQAMVPTGLPHTIAGTALAVARTAHVGAPGLLQFMSTSKLVAGAAVLIGFLGIGLSYHEHVVSREAEAALVGTNREYESLSERLQEMIRSTQSAKQDLEALRSEAASLNVSPQGRRVKSASTKANATAALVAAIRGQPNINQELSKNPEVKAEMAAWLKACYNVQYGPLFTSLGLSAAQIASFENLRMEYPINWGVATISLLPDGGTYAGVTQAIQSLLGTAGYQQLQQYEQTVFVRTVASGLAGNLYDTDTPLSSQQAEQLTEIIAKNSSLPPNSGPPFPGTVNWNSALDQAQGVLSAPQLTVLKNEVTVLTSQPGIWGAMSPISPSSLGSTPNPPAAFYAAQGPKE